MSTDKKGSNKKGMAGSTSDDGQAKLGGGGGGGGTGGPSGVPKPKGK